jgi:hypothetical protein
VKGANRLDRVTHFFQGTTRALCRRPNLARAMIRAVATGDPKLTQQMASFHAQVGELVTMAMRGASAPGEGGPLSEEERAISHSLQMVWFAALVGWTGGVTPQAGIVEQTRTAALLMIREADPGA